MPRKTPTGHERGLALQTDEPPSTAPTASGREGSARVPPRERTAPQADAGGSGRARRASAGGGRLAAAVRMARLRASRAAEESYGERR